MSWLGNLTTGNVLRNIFSLVDPPTKVIEVKSEKYSNRAIILREECLVFYGPSGNEKKYELVILRANCELVFSIFRSGSQEEAEIRFIQLKDKLPLLLTVSATANSLNGIQRVCDTVQNHPSWNVMHLAVSLALTDCLNSEEILRYLNTPDPISGESPLQLAIKEQNLAVIRALVTAKASLDHLDNEANTVFHYAASTNKDIIMALLVHGQQKCLNYRNIAGYTPLHIACQADKPDCVQTLLSQGADVNISASQSQSSNCTPPGYVGDFMQTNHKKLYVQDMKFGGTPLHWACSREVIEQLVDRNCDINVLNFDKRTALHLMVMHGRLDCVVALLSRHADPNIPDLDGNTALHLAVKGRIIAIIQALIVFGADMSYMNGEGQTVRHVAAQETDATADRILYLLHAVGAQRCDKDCHGCTEGCMHGGHKNGTAPRPPPGAQVRAITQHIKNMPRAAGGGVEGGRVLCLDGGGIRGLVLVTILLQLEERVKQPIIHCFDWMAGTSTGAILALALAVGKSLKDCLCLYFRMKEYAFVGNKPYPSEPLETMLQQALGCETVMADITHPKLMVTGVLADRKPVELHLFRNYPSPSELVSPHEHSGNYAAPPPPQEQLVWKAARASGAAPSYFRAFGRFIDGGLIANNPTMDALTEINEYNKALEVLGRQGEMTPPTLVVSVGTGSVPVKELSNVDVFRPESLWDTMRLASGLSSLGALLVDQATLADGRMIDRCSAWCHMINVPYFRLSPQLSEDIAMDEKNDEKLINMLWEAKAYIMSKDEAIDQLAALLTSSGSVAQVVMQLFGWVVSVLAALFDVLSLSSTDALLTVSVGANSCKRPREESIQSSPQDIKWLAKRSKLNVSEDANSVECEDETYSSYFLWKKFF